MSHTHATDERVVSGRRADHPHRPAVEPALPFPYSARSVLGMQLLAGNRAVSLAVQRCGPNSTCDCPPEERAAKEATMQRQTTPVQRQADDQQPAGGGGSGGDGGELPLEEMRALIEEMTAGLSGVSTGIVPWPAEAGARQPDSAVQTLPVQRAAPGAPTPAPATAGGDHAWLEAGVVSSLQGTYDACSGELYASGWIWGGIGTYAMGKWVGAYYFWEGDTDPIQVGKLAECGTCSAKCQPGEHHGGWGFGVFQHSEPGKWKQVKFDTIEVGALITPNSTCDATVELIVLVDVLKTLGPQARLIKTFVEKANTYLAKATKGKLTIDLQGGGQFNGGAHLCRNAAGAVTFDSLTLGGGLWLGGGFGVHGKKKGDLPH
jgi:hypothetical protein